MTVSSHASYFEFDAWLGGRHHPLNCCYTTENNDFLHHHYVCKPQLSFSLKCSSEQGLSEVYLIKIILIEKVWHNPLIP